MNLKSNINEIGRKMLKCSNSCNGISLNINEGILPRCLIFEMKDREENSGSVIVGINPGQSKNDEREYYRINGSTYEQVVAYWQRKVYRFSYYARLRKLVDELELKGPILWTELVKCENISAKSGLPPLQTFRICTKEYLQQELKVIPERWPIIGVGWESYKALSYLFTERNVIGVPHPTGSHGHFLRLFDKKKRLLPELKTQLNKIINGKHSEAIWLSSKYIYRIENRFRCCYKAFSFYSAFANNRWESFLSFKRCFILSHESGCFLVQVNSKN